MSTLTLASLRADLARMLGCVADSFDDPAGLNLLLTVAAADLARAKPVHKRATLTLTADVGDYELPADLLRVLGSDWGQTERRQYEPWEVGYPGRLPLLRRIRVGSTDVLELTPAPTAAQISQLGSSYPYSYAIAHTISEDDASATTVPDEHKDLLLLRAVAEAMYEMAARGVKTPVSLGAAGNNLPKNGAPASLADQFLKAWETACRR